MRERDYCTIRRVVCFSSLLPYNPFHSNRFATLNSPESVNASGALLRPTRIRYTPSSTTQRAVRSSQNDTAYLSSESVTVSLFPGARLKTFPKALRASGG